jgi:AmmeMemoRadiSam system protein B/AmmeMemoRadiSam system protein A
MRLAIKLLSLAALGLCGCGRGGGASPTKTPAAGPVKAPAATVPAPRWDVSQPPALPANAAVRKAAVAGQFYPGDAEALRKDVAARLEKAGKPPELAGKLRAIIVPHAGYTYSADTAAAAYAAVKGKGFDRVVLLGFSHSYPMRKTAVSGAQAYATPLGKVAVDTDFAARLRDAAGARPAPDAEEGEHSIEVQLPFLVAAIGPGVRIVPVLVGSDPAAQEKLAEALAGLLDERTLVVVSTDLAHYPPLDVAQKSDAATVESWKSLDLKKVEAVERKLLLENGDSFGLACTMCGSDPVKVLIRLAPLIGIDAVTVLKTDTSATASGDKTRVVGYASVAFSATGKTPPAVAAAKPGDDLAKPPEISAESRKKLLEIARGAATAAAVGKQPAVLDLQSLPADLRQPGGAFVTLKNRGELRGCIGRYPGEASIAEVVREMGMESARDSRFYDAPVTAAEMKAIDIEISVLSPLVKIDDWKKIKLGVHGVVLRRGGRSGVFLPQVATETGWSLEEFLGHLARDKAGLPAGAYKDSDTEIRVFTALVFGEKPAAQ